MGRNKQLEEFMNEEQNLSDEQLMAEFYEMADKFIHLANELSDRHPPTQISAVMMFAAARYNAFNFFLTDGDSQNEKAAIDYYCEQYRSMLRDNFEQTRILYANRNEKE